jgi:hypothetical protein
MSGRSACPVCGQIQSVSKVSAVYIAGIQAERPAENRAGSTPVRVHGIPEQALPALGRRLAPPAARKEVQLRLVHPDLMVLVFSVVMPFFFSGIYAGQRENFYPALIGLLIAYGFYFTMRRRLVARYEQRLGVEQARKARIERGVQRWMNLYYCAEDDLVFEPGGAPPLPADQIHAYLFQD